MSVTPIVEKRARAGARGRTPALELQLRILTGIALSYALDTALLAGFAADGMLPVRVVSGYFAAGLLNCAVFHRLAHVMPTDPGREGGYVLIQVALCGAVQLAFIAIAPQLAFYFLGLLFIVFGCGSLALSGRQSAVAWAAVAAATGFAIVARGGNLSIPHGGALARSLVWLCFAATLGRCILLGHLGRTLRLRLDRRRSRLSESVAALQERDAALEAANAQLRHLAHHDALTGLANRSLFVERLELAIGGRRSSAVCVLDLDRFKLINDSLGHAAGDSLLQQVAGRLEGAMRFGDTLTRASGDEFLMLVLDVTSAKEVEVIVERSLRAFAPPFAVHGTEIHISPSVGIARYPADGVEAEQLLTRADEAMYQAKQCGRNTYRFFDARATAFSRDRLLLESDLRRALARGEFLLHYQPKIDVATSAVRSVEALLRWNHPQRGMLSPRDFLPIAEETGLMVPIGAWVIDEVCRQTALWRLRGLNPIRVAVNVSAAQFLKSDLAAVVRDAVSRHELDASALEVELGESTLARDPERSRGTLEQLSAMGVVVTVDDFGNGYSSINQLRRFPVDRLKIDRSFIANLESSAEDAAIVRAIISLAHGLRLKVVAEGVESDVQLAALRSMGCDQYQGFYRSAAVPAAQVEAFLGELERPGKSSNQVDFMRTHSKLARSPR